MKLCSPVSPVLTVAWEQWQRTLCWEEEPVLTLSLQWAKLPEDSPGLRRMGRYYEKTVQQWRRRWEGPLYEQAKASVQALRSASRPFRPWQASAAYTLACQTPEVLSLYADTYEYTGGAHGLTLRRGDVWSLPCGLPRPLSSFFPPRCHWRRLVLEQVAQTIRRRIDSGESWFDPDWPQLIVKQFDPERFYCTPEGPVVFYPLYAIAPYAEGIPAFPITPPQAQEKP